MGLPVPAQPFAWAIGSDDLVLTTHGPVTPEGTILQASIEAQAHLTFQHFKTTIEAAGGTMEHGTRGSRGPMMASVSSSF